MSEAEKEFTFGAETVRAIFEEIRENHRRLDRCPGPHDFGVTDQSGFNFRQKCTCSKCGGVLDGVALRWYLKGLEHGKKLHAE